MKKAGGNISLISNSDLKEESKARDIVSSELNNSENSLFPKNKLFLEIFFIFFILILLINVSSISASQKYTLKVTDEHPFFVIASSSADENSKFVNDNNDNKDDKENIINDFNEETNIINVNGDINEVAGESESKVDDNNNINGIWKTASELKIGDSLLTADGKKARVTSVKEIEEDVEVYNLKVDSYEDYFAENVLVHNKPVPYGESKVSTKLIDKGGETLTIPANPQKIDVYSKLMQLFGLKGALGEKITELYFVLKNGDVSKIKVQLTDEGITDKDIFGVGTVLIRTTGGVEQRKVGLPKHISDATGIKAGTKVSWRIEGNDIYVEKGQDYIVQGGGLIIYLSGENVVNVENALNLNPKSKVWWIVRKNADGSIEEIQLEGKKPSSSVEFYDSNLNGEENHISTNIPVEIVNLLELKEGEYATFIINGNKVIITKGKTGVLLTRKKPGYCRTLKEGEIRTSTIGLASNGKFYRMIVPAPIVNDLELKAGDYIEYSFSGYGDFMRICNNGPVYKIVSVPKEILRRLPGNIIGRINNGEKVKAEWTVVNGELIIKVNGQQISKQGLFKEKD